MLNLKKLGFDHMTSYFKNKTNTRFELSQASQWEEKYKIPLWLIAAKLIEFSIIIIILLTHSHPMKCCYQYWLEDEIKLYEMILDRSKTWFYQIIRHRVYKNQQQVVSLFVSFHQHCAKLEHPLKSWWWLTTRTSIITDSLTCNAGKYVADNWWNG